MVCNVLFFFFWVWKIEVEFICFVFLLFGFYEIEMDLLGFFCGDLVMWWVVYKIVIEMKVFDFDEVC